MHVASPTHLEKKALPTWLLLSMTYYSSRLDIATRLYIAINSGGAMTDIAAPRYKYLALLG